MPPDPTQQARVEALEQAIAIVRHAPSLHEALLELLELSVDIKRNRERKP